MTLPPRIVPVIICASVLWAVGICSGQTIPPPDPANSAPSTGGAATLPALTAPPVTTPKSDSPPVESAPAPKSSEVAPAKEGSGAKQAAATKPARRQTIGSLDVIEVKVWNPQNLTGFYTVSPEGTISIPLLGDLKADGLTREELAQVIREKLGESILAKVPEPNEVTVQIARNNSKKVFVFGGVARPGEFPLDGDMTVLDLLSLCLPFKEFAKPKAIYIQRGNPPTTKKFNYVEVSHGKKMDQNYHLEPGDRIYVPEN